MEGNGAVAINGRDILQTGRSSHRYFMEYPLTVTAIPGEGAAFKGWKSSGAYSELEDPAALTTRVTFTRTFTLTAVFE